MDVNEAVINKEKLVEKNESNNNLILSLDVLLKITIENMLQIFTFTSDQIFQHVP